jgi:uncharacterized membrane protein
MEERMAELGSLTLAAFAWVAVHVGIAGTRVRNTVASRIGDAGFRGLFSVLSVAAITALVVTYQRARLGDRTQLWIAPDWLGWLLVLLMAFAFTLLIGAFTVPNPTAVGGERALGQEPRGLLRITRHPMLWSFTIWSLVHIIGNGNLVSLLFFGAFGLTALVGMPSIDRKLASRDPQGWAQLSRVTSILPFAAILSGRNRLVLREIGWIAPLAGLALWVALLLLHPRLFGVSPLPG